MRVEGIVDELGGLHDAGFGIVERMEDGVRVRGVVEHGGKRSSKLTTRFELSQSGVSAGRDPGSSEFAAVKADQRAGSTLCLVYWRYGEAAVEAHSEVITSEVIPFLLEVPRAHEFSFCWMSAPTSSRDFRIGDGGAGLFRDLPSYCS